MGNIILMCIFHLGYCSKIIGGGPAGFYTAKKILEENEDAQIHIFEKLPFPFGLIRYGVAPDH